MRLAFADPELVSSRSATVARLQDHIAWIRLRRACLRLGDASVDASWPSGEEEALAGAFDALGTPGFSAVLHDGDSARASRDGDSATDVIDIVALA